MAYPMFQSYQPFGTLSANSSPVSTYSTNSLVPCQRTLSNVSYDSTSDGAIEHVSEDEYDAMMDNNPLWPSVFATPKGSDLPLADLSGYSSTLPWANQSELQLQRVVSVGPRRDSAGAEPRPGSSLSKVWGPDHSPEDQRRQSESSSVDYNASEPRARMSMARSVGMGRSSSLLAQAAMRRSSTLSNGSGSLSMSYDPDEAEQVRRIRSLDQLGRRFSDAVYIEPAEPDSPDSESSEEEEERDWTPDLHSKVNIWSPETDLSDDDDDDDEIRSLPALATPEFRPAAAELSNFPLTSFARQAQSMAPSPNLDYIAGDTGRGVVPLRGWQFPDAGRPLPVLPSQYLIPALPSSHAGESLRISSTLGHTSPSVTQSSFKRSASSPLFAARNGDAEAFSRGPSGGGGSSKSLRTMIPMAPAVAANGRASLARHLSDCKEELTSDPVVDSTNMLRQGSYAEENRQFEFLAAQITVDSVSPSIDYAFPGLATPRTLPRSSTGISRPNAPSSFVLPSFGQGWSSPLLASGGLTPKYNPMDSFLGKTATPTLPTASQHQPPRPVTAIVTPPMAVEARYMEETVHANVASPRMRPRSGDVAVSHTERHGQHDVFPRPRPNSSGSAIVLAPVIQPTATKAFATPEWRSPWPQPPRLIRSVTAPVSGAVGLATSRKPVPIHLPESPVLGHTFSPEPNHSTRVESVSRDRKKSHKHSTKCRRCEEKVMMRLLLDQAKKAQEDAAIQALKSPRTPRSTTSSSDGKSECPGHHQCGCCSRATPATITGIRRPMSAVLLSSEFRRGSKDLAGVFPEPPKRASFVPSAHDSPIPAFATGGLPTIPTSPVNRMTRVRHARTPSPKRHKQLLRDAVHRSPTTDMHISGPVLISTTSNRVEIPVAARGPPMTMELLQGTVGDPPRELRPINRHSSGSFPQDAGAASSNPNAPAAHSPRPNMRRAVSSDEPIGPPVVSMHGHLAKKPSTSFFKFLHAGQARHADPTSPNFSSDSGGRSPKSPEVSTSTGGVFHRGHRHSSSSASSTTTFASGGRSRPISSSSSGSDRTLVDLKETFKLFAGNAKGRKAMQEDIEEGEFEGAEEVLREERQEERRLASKLGPARRHRVGRYPSMMG